MAELKPCPFCGNRDITIEVIKPHKHSDWLIKEIPELPDCPGECFIECGKCTCAICAETEEKAIEAWNRRV